MVAADCASRGSGCECGQIWCNPLFVGTLLISFIAICIAAPVGLMAAIYMAEYASSSVRAFAKPLLEILAGIPTVVYGFFAALTVAPLFRDWADQGGFQYHQSLRWPLVSSWVS